MSPYEKLAAGWGWGCQVAICALGKHQAFSGLENKRTAYSAHLSCEGGIGKTLSLRVGICVHVLTPRGHASPSFPPPWRPRAPGGCAGAGQGGWPGR